MPLRWCWILWNTYSADYALLCSCTYVKCSTTTKLPTTHCVLCFAGCLSCMVSWAIVTGISVPNVILIVRLVQVYRATYHHFYSTQCYLRCQHPLPRLHYPANVLLSSPRLSRQENCKIQYLQQFRLPLQKIVISSPDKSSLCMLNQKAQFT